MRVDSVFEDEEDSLSFLLLGAADAEANSLRHALMRDVRCLAVDTLTVKRNRSCFVEEFVAHRVGQVPLRWKGGEVPPPDLVVRLTGGSCVAGPLMSSHLRFDTPDVEVALDVVLVDLVEGDAIEFEATARVGTGIEHARFGCVVAPRYEYKTVVGMSDGGGALTLNEVECFCKDAAWGERCDVCGWKKRGKEHAHGKRTHLFSFETTGAVKARSAIGDAMAAMVGRWEDLGAEMERQRGGGVGERGV